ncbi:MAG TPA: RagB/SusD family nutrient uptake outer membrane protein [Sphingobacterium sp.]|nr:RagB/SusD family nutrient uptake outer membrane protein [Sphingobacterium sp.]
MKLNQILIAVIFFSLTLVSSCGKDFLEVKADVSINTPTSIADYQALLDNAGAIMNGSASHIFALIGADEFYLKDAQWNGFNANLPIKNAYIWADDVYENTTGDDWDNGYRRILYANMVLEGLARISPLESEREAWNLAYGSAHFFKALNYYQLAGLFCAVYSENTANKDLGIVLREESDVNVKSQRSTVGQTYERILYHLSESIPYLPDVSMIKTRPSKAASYALLARVYTQMERYDLALDYADKAQMLSNVLLDYNKLSTTTQYPFQNDFGVSNPEVIFFCYAIAVPLLTRTRMHIDPELWALYREHDRRREVFYTTGTISNTVFRGSFNGSTSFFVGLSTPEVLLIRAECLVRLGRIAEGLSELNRLGTYRYVPGGFESYGDTDQNAALKAVLDERRMELAFKGLRWGDLRRLNKDARFRKTIERAVNGTVYRLEPNSDKYVWPIPDNVIRITGIQQNSR